MFNLFIFHEVARNKIIVYIQYMTIIVYVYNEKRQDNSFLKDFHHRVVTIVNYQESLSQ